MKKLFGKLNAYFEKVAHAEIEAEAREHGRSMIETARIVKEFMITAVVVLVVSSPAIWFFARRIDPIGAAVGAAINALILGAVAIYNGIVWRKIVARVALLPTFIMIPGCDVSVEEILEMMKRRGYRPASAEELTKYLNQETSVSSARLTENDEDWEAPQKRNDDEDW